MAGIPVRSYIPLALALATAAVACGGNAPSAQGQGAPPPAGVKLLAVAEKPIEQTSDFISTVRSLKSTTVQPEVEGIVNRIFVKSGDRVRVGSPLVQINADKQQAAVRSTEANGTGMETDVAVLAPAGQASRIARRRGGNQPPGIRSGAELAAYRGGPSGCPRCASARGTRRAAVYRVDAPQAGVVGDIPVRVGDRVTNSTVITTIDENASLEAYVQVPLDRSPDLRLGLPVQLLDAEGKIVATNSITFVAPRVDDATQTVLVKSLLREIPPALRVQQFVRARIIWRTTPGISIPITAVSRVSGQYFCFVAEDAANGGLVARQRPVQVGELLGNDYVVRSGLKPGERIIVAGVQKVGDGAPIKAE